VTLWRTTIRLALSDLLAERVLALCSVLSLAAVLAPLIVLAGLRAGVIEGLRELLLEDPHAREIVTAANRSLDAALLDGLERRPDVSFLAPRTRTLAASLLLELPEVPGQGIRADLIPTAPGDPLIAAPPTSDNRVVLSASAAAKLHVAAGDALVGRLARIREGKRDSIPLPLIVQTVAAPSAFDREAAFVTLGLAVFVEDFQDGRADAPPGGMETLSRPQRSDYAGFRLYARRLDQVPELDAALRAQGIDVSSRAGDVSDLLRIDTNLTVLFALIAGLGTIGFLIALGAGLWANVERKRVSLALLRFLGLRSGSLRLFPMAQALVLSLTGGIVALGAAEAAAAIVNQLLAGTLQLDRPLCRITPLTASIAVAATITGSLMVAAVAGSRAAKIDPWEGVSAA
jgi:putative ABC transport system permease protein